MDTVESLTTALRQLRELFADKSELRGLNDWDVFLGSVLLIENAITTLSQNDTEG